MAQAIPPLGTHSTERGAHSNEETLLSYKSWMPLYVGDLLSDTLDLTAAEFGAYVLLICAYWQNGGPLPSDRGRIRRILRNPKRFDELYDRVSQYFTDTGDILVHQRIDIELNRSRIAHAKRTLGAEITNAKRTQSGTQLQPQPQSEKIKEVIIEGAVAPKAKRASRIDPNWTLSEQGRCYAKDRGLDQATIDGVAEGFRDHWIASAGKGAVALDWDAKWRTWVNNHLRFTGSQTTAGGKRPTANHADRGSITAARDKILAKAGIFPERDGAESLGLQVIGGSWPNGNPTGSESAGPIIDADYRERSLVAFDGSENPDATTGGSDNG